MSNEDLDECFKTLSGLTVGQGKIRLKPHQNKNIQLGIDPTRLSFHDTHTTELLIRVKTHQLFVFKSDTISKAENPVRLTKQVKW